MSNERPAEAESREHQLRRLHAFLGNRTIGTMKIPGQPPRLHWRGPGYDEGWEDLTPQEIDQFWQLLTTPTARFGQVGPMVHPADIPASHETPDPRPVCRHEYAGHGGPCEVSTIQCQSTHPDFPHIQCVLDDGHPPKEDHFSTSGCAGSEVSWPHRSIQEVLENSIARADGSKPWEEKREVCGKPYVDRNGDPDTCSFPPNHDGSCW